jgi:hypothetical protein
VRAAITIIVLITSAVIYARSRPGIDPGCSTGLASAIACAAVSSSAYCQPVDAGGSARAERTAVPAREVAPIRRAAPWLASSGVMSPGNVGRGPSAGTRRPWRRA